MKTTIAINVASLLAMDLKAVKAEFKKIAAGIESGYAGLGKLIVRYWQIEKKQDGHYDAFRDAADKSTISNAVFFAHAYRLVADGHLDDDAFDKLASFRVCRAVKKFLDGEAPVKMDPAKVASILTGKDGAKNIVSLSEHGLTVAEKAAADKAAAAAEKAAAKAEEEARIKAAAEKLAAEAAAKAAADKAAENADKILAEAAAKKAAAKKAAAESTPPPAPVQSAPEESAPEESEDEAPPAPEVSAPPAPVLSAPAATTPPPAPAKPAAPAAATPTATPATTKSPADRAMDALATVENIALDLLADPVANRVVLLAICERLNGALTTIEKELEETPVPAATAA